ncbi:MAG: glutamine synthetase beta-grasp domain-containing protein [Patescibacteria group bacterium]
MKTKLEYVWLDGYTPEPSLRSKTKIVDAPIINIEDVPEWSFDGSSTKQATGHYSDCLLKPVAIIPDPGRVDAMLVMCEVLNPDRTPHQTNMRALVTDVPDLWFGFEQEYVLMKNGRPLGFPEDASKFPGPQGPYYCAVGTENIAGRSIVEKHLDLCLSAGLGITGINAEVLLGQWEYQLFEKGALQAADRLWLSRYLLLRTAEEYGLEVTFLPKPLTGDWNGSGMHTNFSNEKMRSSGGKEYFESIFKAFENNHKKHIDMYGSLNDMRLTGQHETQSIDAFSVGVSDRGASIRIPQTTITGEYKGYLEDRRPSAHADPYKVVKVISETLNETQ